MQKWGRNVANRWKICREKFGEKVKYDDPGFQELYLSIAEIE